MSRSLRNFTATSIRGRFRPQPWSVRSVRGALHASAGGRLLERHRPRFEGKPLTGVSIQLRAQGCNSHSNRSYGCAGHYSFTALRSGTYALRAEIAGYSDAEIRCTLSWRKRTEDRRPHLARSQAHGIAIHNCWNAEVLRRAPISVAGVTDTTSLGGHGSDTVVRTRETIAKETVSLGKDPSNANSVAEVEAVRSLREAVQRDPGSFDTNHRLGKLLAENGKAHEAIPYLERASELKSGDYENSYDLALANDAVGNYDLARHSAQTLLAHKDKAETPSPARPMFKRTWAIRSRRCASINARLNSIPVSLTSLIGVPNFCCITPQSPRQMSSPKATSCFLVRCAC